MNIHRLFVICISLAAMVVFARAGFAAEFRDPKTGLAVDPPPGFTARPGEPILGDTVEIVVERASPATSCSVSFEESAGNLGLTQEQINDIANKEQWLELIRLVMSATGEILSLDRMTQNGAVGAVLITKSKIASLAHIRVYQALF
jgi:hypothetical protein